MKIIIPAIFLFFFCQNHKAQFNSSDLFKNHCEKLDKRNEWMFKQRLYPYADNNLIEKSFKQRNQLRQQGMVDFSSSWTALGPNPATFNFESATSRVRVIAYDPDSTNIIYIGTSNGGVWKTTDGGLNWAPKTDFQPSLSSGALAVYNDWSSNPPKRIVYYGTGEGGFGFVYNYYGRGLLKSEDGGETWRQITKGLPSTTYFYRIVINPVSPNVLLAALGSGYANPVNTGGLYRSEDYGETWTRIVPSSIGEEGLNCTDVIFSPNGIKAYALGPFITGSPNWWENGCGYRISNDGGRTFTQTATNLPGTGYLAISKTFPDLMYALTVVDCNLTQLYRSADGGNSWAWIYENFASNQCGYNMAVAVHPTDPNIVYASTLVTYKSTDRGNTFLTGNTIYHFDHHDIEFNPKNPNEMMVANDGGIAKSTNNGLSFINLNKTLSTLECYSVSGDMNDENHILTGTQDNGVQRKNNSSRDWNGLTAYDATTVIIDPGNPNIYIAQLSASNTGIHVSTNSGSFWVAVQGFNDPSTYAWQRPIVNHPNLPGVYLTGEGDKVYQSNDFGQIWFPVSNSGVSGKIEELAISQSNPNVIYAATGPFEFMPNATQHKLFITRDFGQSWTDITGSLKKNSPAANLPNRYISAIQVDKDDENTAFVAFAGFGTEHIFQTTDGGVSWFSIDCDGTYCLPDAPVNDFIIRYDSETGLNEYYAATDIGVFARTGENLWHELGDGLPNCIVMDLNLTGNKLRAATFGRGIFEWTLPISPADRKKTKIQNDLTAYNYPNPFNPETEIRFELHANSYIKLEIYDVTGRLITILADGNFEPSVYNFKWNASEFSSGIYFFRLQKNDEFITKKMMLLK